MRSIQQFSDPVRLVEGRHGFMVYNQYCHYVGRALELYGEYCEHEVVLLTKLLKPSDVVWEIGANTGSMSVALARAVGKGAYVGFEPQPELYKIFVTNLALNNCESARTMNFGLGDRNTIVNLPAVNYHLPNNFGSISLIGSFESRTGTSVEIRPMDELHWLPDPTLLKIDVEGMEIDVLGGGRETIKRCRPVIYVENDRIDNSPKLIETLWNYGYELFWHISPYYNDKNFFKNPNNIYGNILSFNMLCMPKDKSIRVNGLPKITDPNLHPLKR